MTGILFADATRNNGIGLIGREPTRIMDPHQPVIQDHTGMCLKRCTMMKYGIGFIRVDAELTGSKQMTKPKIFVPSNMTAGAMIWPTNAMIDAGANILIDQIAEAHEPKYRNLLARAFMAMCAKAANP